MNKKKQTVKSDSLFLFAKKLVQKTEHPAGLNKWGPLRVSNVLRPDNWVAGPWVGWAHGGVCSVCGRAQWPWRVLRTAGAAGVRGYLWARVRWVFGSSGVGVFCARLWVYPVCYEVDSSPLFNFNRIFPPFPGACRNLAQKPLI